MRETAHWQGQPGNTDVLHTNPQFGVREFTPRWGMPVVQPYTTSPEWIPQIQLWGKHERNKSTFVHFFTDDYRFESLWSRPWRGLDAMQKQGGAVGPDFSCYSGWPRAVNLWNSYRSKWLMAFWQANGVKVIPTATWAGAESWPYCFDGLPKASWLALAVPRDGSQLHEVVDYLGGVERLVEKLNPLGILLYGTESRTAEINRIAKVEVVKVYPQRLTKRRLPR